MIHTTSRLTALFGLFVLLAVAGTGCSTISFVNPRAMTVDDVIRMSEHEVGPDIIIRQIEVTGSRYELSADDIVALTEAGVNEDVIEFMVGSGESPVDPYWSASPGYYDGWGYGYGYYPSPWSWHLGYGLLSSPHLP